MKIRDIEKWKEFEFDGYRRNKHSGLPGDKGEDYKIIRPRKDKSCYCGNHSMGKETFFYVKNKRLYGIRLLKKQKKVRKNETKSKRRNSFTKNDN